MVYSEYSAKIQHWLYKTILYLPYFLKTVKEYNRLNKHESFKIKLKYLSIILNEIDLPAGTVKGHYFWQDLWVAKKIYENKPTRHIDIGSRIDGFIAHLLVFMPVEVIDIRAISCDVPGLKFVKSDATDLKDFDDSSLESISALHSIEHFGLGRFGDPVDPDACFKVMRHLVRVLKQNGHLYFSVPIGRERLYFNEHRIFSPKTILDIFNSLELLSFSGVDDAGNFYPKAKIEQFIKAKHSLGIYDFTKL